MSEIRVHIGPPKSASTSIQEALYGHRSDLLTSGVLYPEPAWSTFHHEEACDFLNLATSTPPLLNTHLTRYVQARPRRRRECWRRLLERVASHDGPSIISVEMLAFFTDELAAEFVADLPSDDVVVVMVERPASQVLPSWFQEMGRHEVVGEFDLFVARVVEGLVTGQPSLGGIINHQDMFRRWCATGADVRVIDATAGLSSQTVQDALDVLVPEAAPLTLERSRANAGMSALGVHLFARHVAACPPKYAGSAHAVERRMREAFPAATDVGIGGALALRPEFAQVLDRFCAIDSDGRPTGADLIAAGRHGMVEPARWEPFSIEAALSRMRRWQVKEDRRWTAMSAVHRSIGRGSLIPGAFKPREWQ